MSTIANPTTGLPFPTQTALGGATTRSKLGALVQCGTTAGAVTVQRPSSRTEGSLFAAVDSDGNAATNNITVDGDGDLIDGAATVVITVAGGSAIFLYDAGQWRRLVVRRLVNGVPPLLEFAVDADPSGGGGSVGAADTVQTSDGAGGFRAATDVKATASVVAIGPQPASVGSVRLPATGERSVFIRDSVNVNDIALIDIDASDAAYFGYDRNLANAASDTLVGGRQSCSLGIEGFGPLFQVTNVNENRNGQPIVGDGVPYGAHGGIVTAFPADADYVVPASVYRFSRNEFTVGAWLATHSAIYPAPASKAMGYALTIVNLTAFLMTVTTGAGTSRTLAAGLGQCFWFDDGGVKFAGATFVP